MLAIFHQEVWQAQVIIVYPLSLSKLSKIFPACIAFTFLLTSMLILYVFDNLSFLFSQRVKTPLFQNICFIKLQVHIISCRTGLIINFTALLKKFEYNF